MLLFKQSKQFKQCKQSKKVYSAVLPPSLMVFLHEGALYFDFLGKLGFCPKQGLWGLS